VRDKGKFGTESRQLQMKIDPNKPAEKRNWWWFAEALEPKIGESRTLDPEIAALVSQILSRAFSAHFYSQRVLKLPISGSGK
jgi:hypothetical protein